MWVLWALAAAVLWGFDYAFAERVLKHVSISVFMAIQLFAAGVVAALVAWAQGHWSRDLHTLASSRSTLTLFLLGLVAFTVANAFIFIAIQKKDATLSGLIEISYPLFVAFISWLVFRESQLTWSAGIGGALIFAGIFVIYYFNR